MKLTKKERLQTMIELLKGKISYYEDEMEKCIPHIKMYQELRDKRLILKKELTKRRNELTKLEIMNELNINKQNERGTP